MSLFGAPSYSPVGGEYCHTDNTDDTDKTAGLRVKRNILPTEDGGAAVQGSRFKVQGFAHRGRRSCWFKVQKRCRAFKVQGCPQIFRILTDFFNFIWIIRQHKLPIKHVTQIAQSSQIRQQSCWFKVQMRCRAFKVQGCPQRAAELPVQSSKALSRVQSSRVPTDLHRFTRIFI